MRHQERQRHALTVPKPHRPVAARGLLTATLSVLLVLMPGCAYLLTGTTDPGKVQTIMDSTHARGCVYGRASASPWASATVVLVGTFGDPPPTLSECWKQLPPELP